MAATKDEVKAAIEKKFGSLSNFSRIVGRDRYEYQKLFARKNPEPSELSDVMKLVRSHKSTLTGNVIDPDKLKKLKKAVEKYGGAYKLGKDHPEFSTRQIYFVIDGKRSRMTDFVQSLFDFFGID